MNTVWAVEQGSYSDYHVVGVYSQREYAEKIAAKINAVGGYGYGDATVAEWPLDPGLEALAHGMDAWFLRMNRDGETVYISCYGWDKDFLDVGPLKIYPGRPNKPGPRLQGTVWARDAKHAIKIVNEKRLAMIASGEWPEEP